MTVQIEIGEGRTIEPVCYPEDGPTVGYIERHPRPDTGEICSGFLWIDATSEAHVDGPVWDVVQADPLTLNPSIKCRACGNHGFIRDGRWVPA